VEKKNSNIASVISFCTYDLRFLDKCIQSVKPFSSQILIPVCDHFYNGLPEDRSLLEKIYHKYQDIDFVEFAYSEEEFYGTPVKFIPGSPEWGHQWHNSGRLVASYFLNRDITHILFLDVDEIFSENLYAIPFGEFEALRFATYWYFKSANSCATVYPDGPLLLKRELLSHELLLNIHERMGMYLGIKGKKQREYLHKGKPIVHHYSWVRTREEMLQKVRSWAHHWERNWEELIDQEEDFVRKYSYREIEPFWEPLQEVISLPEEKKQTVRKVTAKEIFRMEILHQIQL
jgi:hypothetical protein